MGWKCFIIHETPYLRREYRRYGNQKCDKTISGIHDTTVLIDAQIPDAGLVESGFLPTDEELRDPRWPKTCACGHKFHPEEAWQVNLLRLYRGFPDDKLYCLRDPNMPPGAMWDADWLGKNYQGPDGKCWTVQLPGGYDFPIFSVASGTKQKWNVTGSAPTFTLSPSINCEGVYHGWIQNGIITEDCEGRPFQNIPRTA